MSGHVVSSRTYIGIFAVLMLLTALTVWVAFVDLGPMNDVVAMSIATFKATLVVLYFMHVRYGTRLVSVSIATAVLFFFILVGLTLADYNSRGWL